jgi:hypothetical protein
MRPATKTRHTNGGQAAGKLLKRVIPLSVNIAARQTSL